MQCPICGHQLEENDAFCSNCGNFALPLKDSRRSTASAASATSTASASGTSDTASRPPHKVAERLYPPPETDIEPPAAPSRTSASSRAASGRAAARQTPRAEAANPPDVAAPAPKPKAGRGLKIFSVICCILMVAAIAFAVYTLVSTSSLQVQLLKAQRENSTSAATIDALETQINGLTNGLGSVNSDTTSLGLQVAELQTQLSEMESTVSQSTYDKENAERQLEEATAQLSEISEANTGLTDDLAQTQEALEEAQEENAELSDENSSLRSTVSSYETQLNFYDTYVVFVMLSSDDKYYHKYSCPEFTQRNFLAYSVKLAEANGYTPCPICFESAAVSDDTDTE